MKSIANNTFWSWTRRGRRRSALDSIGAVIALLALVSVGGCIGGSSESGDSDPILSVEAVETTTQTYDARGIVRSITPSKDFVVIQHGDIAGFMDGMTMAFALKAPSVADGVQPDDSVEFNIEVTGSSVVVSSITTVAVAPQGQESNNNTSPLGEIKHFDGSTIAAASFSTDDLAGRVIVLNFWATWCGPCREEIPDFVHLQDSLGVLGLQIVGISLDETSDAELLVTQFAVEFEMNYPILIDDGTVADLYGGNYALPTTFVIGRDGMIRHRVIGSVSAQTLEPILGKLLAQDAPA